MKDAPFQFSLRWLLFCVAFCAIGAAALLNANQGWRTLITSVSMLAWMVAILIAVFQSGPSRAFAIGFVAWGTLYVAVWISFDSELWSGTRLGTTRVLELVYSMVSKTTQVTTVFGTAATVLPEVHFFNEIGHFLWAWLIAICGGLLAKFLYLKSQRTSAAHTP